MKVDVVWVFVALLVSYPAYELGKGVGLRWARRLYAGK